MERRVWERNGTRTSGLKYSVSLVCEERNRRVSWRKRFYFGGEGGAGGCECKDGKCCCPKGLSEGGQFELQ